uniref:Uncharacterized protein n=1 Tax=Neobodo designis TaxID=312471 RepID=A0A7S1PQC8_NEODS|mmetsp:Transcript_15640/g.48448  ORF Transcript_15640/g.48448 Transcript_15640/m.48448 type:complete len:165 (+) Transcript_15640:31-525(+)
MLRRAIDSAKVRYHDLVNRFVGPDRASFVRYGARFPLWTVFSKSLPIPVFVLTVSWMNVSSWSQWKRRDEALDALNENRMRFYGQSFQPVADRGIEGVYMPTQGYVSIDGVTGINRGLDGRYQAAPTKELVDNLAHVPVTPKMLERARELHEQSRAEHERNKLP